MILFMLLLVILFILAIVIAVAAGVIGVGVLLLFGDIIVFVLIMIWIFKNLFKKRK